MCIEAHCDLLSFIAAQQDAATRAGAGQAMVSLSFPSSLNGPFVS